MTIDMQHDVTVREMYAPVRTITDGMKSSPAPAGLAVRSQATDGEFLGLAAYLLAAGLASRAV